ncbi:GNAT family N-acetyltransferase [Rhizobium halophytocola]|uniref:RimJ/RimL family protein N-acetyltransferase n=1 Tax=Rhizobium halophytocola TaxID=735519 RepID=A0ABS4DXZ3_9HYPH|nr:GNAT family N-acetyltransferase [Rhizobium halophytocola]MBP1850557.1 RimJ/RimL family protein N-acetyltransferase [Rhizobium halophytocola]
MDTLLQQERTADILTDRLRLRLPCKADFEPSAALWADERTVRYITGLPSPRNISWARILRGIGHWHVMGYGYWTVEDRMTGAFLGEVGFADFKRGLDIAVDGLPEAGWVMTPAWQGRGFASEAVAAMMQWGDRYLPSRHTYCLIAPEHGASIRVAEKAGFRLTGRIAIEDKPALVLERLPS